MQPHYHIDIRMRRFYDDAMDHYEGNWEGDISWEEFLSVSQYEVLKRDGEFLRILDKTTSDMMWIIAADDIDGVLVANDNLESLKKLFY